MIQDLSDLLSPRRQEIDPTSVPYSDEALSADLKRLDTMWEEFQSSRDRNAVYLLSRCRLQSCRVWEALGQLRSSRAGPYGCGRQI